MKDILVIGGGKIGSVVAALLADTPEAGGYRVTVADRSAELLADIERDARQSPGIGGHLSGRLSDRITTRLLDVTDPAQLADALRGRFAVLSAAPYHLTLRVAQAAKAAGVHYLDLTEDVASTRAIRALADGDGDGGGEGGKRCAFIPQCGLAPGFIAIVAADLARQFDTLDSVRMRVGALPAYPSNALNYNLTWSTEGVINEYCEPCEAIVDGHQREVPALEEREEFSLDGVLYEAFNTSGGLGTLCETLAGKVRTLNYRTIRYPGHAAIMKALLHDLRLKDRRDVLKDILEQSLPATLQDVVIVFVTVAGQREGRLMQDTYVRKIYSQVLAGKMRSAIQITTASSLCAMLDMLAAGELPQHGFVKQEDVPLAAFLGNRFGRVYRAEALAHAA
ncbi:MAG: saccharopine dehydrogenase family protein [Bacteriovorax sp.]|nr:saccharopine dehydrogenase family protein [Rhizobacter sp.]